MLIARFPTGGRITPTYVGSTAYVDSNSASAAPDASGLSLAAGDILLCFAYCATSGAVSPEISAPSGEGWVQGGEVHTTASSPTTESMQGKVFSKVWGVPGNTDDSTPTFTSDLIGLGAVISVWRKGNRANPIQDMQGASANGTQPTPSATAGDAHDSTQHFFGCRVLSGGNLSAPSSGTSAYSGASYSQTSGPDRAMASSYVEGVGTTGAVGGSNNASATTSKTMGVTFNVILKAG